MLKRLNLHQGASLSVSCHLRHLSTTQQQAPVWQVMMFLSIQTTTNHSLSIQTPQLMAKCFSLPTPKEHYAPYWLWIQELDFIREALLFTCWQTRVPGSKMGNL